MTVSEMRHKSTRPTTDQGLAQHAPGHSDLAPSRELTNRKPITAHHARPRGDLTNAFEVTASSRESSRPGGISRMPATTVDAVTNTERESDVATTAEKSAVTLKDGR